MLRYLITCWFSLISITGFTLPLQIPLGYKNKLSVLVMDANSKQVIYAYQSDIPRLIASNMKLFTTLFALKYLTPSFSWHTKLAYIGTIRHGSLIGNLYVQGGGDPTLSDKSLDQMFSQLKALGVKQIKGKIILDSSIFNSQPTYSMLKYQAYDSDTVLPSGLLVNGNLTKFDLHLVKHRFLVNNNLYHYTIINHLTINKNNGNCQDIYKLITVKLAATKVKLSGKLPKACNNKVVEYNLLPVNTYNQMEIKQALAKLAIRLVGSFAIGATPSNATLIVDYASNNLAQVLITMNQYSVNLIAETLLLSVGAFTTANTNTYTNACNIFYTFLRQNNLINPKFKLENAAGLSRYEYFSVQNIVDLLALANTSPFKSIFEQTLPRPGGNGTLQATFLQFANQLHAKTGSLNDTKAYSGYFYAKNGHKYIISIVINGIDATNHIQVNLFNNWVAQLLTQLNQVP